VQCSVAVARDVRGRREQLHACHQRSHAGSRPSCITLTVQRMRMAAPPNSLLRATGQCHRILCSLLPTLTPHLPHEPQRAAQCTTTECPATIELIRAQSEISACLSRAVHGPAPPRAHAPACHAETRGRTGSKRMPSLSSGAARSALLPVTVTYRATSCRPQPKRRCESHGCSVRALAPLRCSESASALPKNPVPPVTST
jgi:hypothetical protein